MKPKIQLFIGALFWFFISCENSHESNLRIDNLIEGKEVPLQIFKYTTLENAMYFKNDTVPFKTIRLVDQLRETLPEGRYYMISENDESNKMPFHFFIKNGASIRIAYDGEFTAKRKQIAEYSMLMNHFPRLREDIAINMGPNMKYLDSLFQNYTESLNELRNSSSEIFDQMFLEEELYLYYLIHPIIGHKYGKKIGNFDVVNSKGTFFKFSRSPSADSLTLLSFYNGSDYKIFLTNSLNKLKEIDIHDPFVEGKSFPLLTIIDRDINSAPIILEYMEPGLYPFNEYLEKQISESENSQYAQNLLISLANHFETNQELSIRYNHLLIKDHPQSWYVQQEEAGRRIRQFHLPAGSKAPDFSLTTLDGETITLSDYQGKYLLIDFWGTWCPPCRDEIPDLNRLNLQAKNFDLEIIGVAKDNQKDLVDFLQTHQVTYQTVLATDTMLSDYGVVKYPTKFLMGKTGNIVSKEFKLSEVAEMIEKEEGKLLQK